MLPGLDGNWAKRPYWAMGADFQEPTVNRPGWNVWCCTRLSPFPSRIFGIFLGLAMTVAVAAPGEEPGKGSFPTAPIKFDIPAQPLSDALYIYSSVTGIEILIPGDMVLRLRSFPVTGTFPPEDALRGLLAGTGLAPRNTGTNAFTLVPDTRNTTTTALVPRYPQYSAALQASVTSALCRLRETRPGGYRVAVRLWVSSTGAVKRVGFLGTTGDADRDAILAGLLGRLVINERPPADLHQPTTVVVLPRRDTADCDGGGAEKSP